MILITGATGQVGFEALKALIAGGAEVRALVRNPAALGDLQGAEIVQGSFEDDASLTRASRQPATYRQAVRHRGLSGFSSSVDA